AGAARERSSRNAHGLSHPQAVSALRPHDIVEEGQKLPFHSLTRNLIHENGRRSRRQDGSGLLLARVNGVEGQGFCRRIGARYDIYGWASLRRRRRVARELDGCWIPLLMAVVRRLGGNGGPGVRISLGLGVRVRQTANELL